MEADVLEVRLHILEYVNENLDFWFENLDYPDENLDYLTDNLEYVGKFLDFHPHILKDGAYLLEYMARNLGIIDSHLMVKPFLNTIAPHSGMNLLNQNMKGEKPFKKLSTNCTSQIFQSSFYDSVPFWGAAIKR